MPSHSSRSSRRTFLSIAGAASAFVWIPKPVRGYTAAEMRAMTDRNRRQARHLEVGARHSRALRRPRQDGEERRDDAGGAEEERPPQPSALQDAQMRRDREVSARHRIDWHLLRQAQRSRGDGRQRRRQDPDDDVEPVEEQDQAGHGAEKGAPELHSGRRRRAERARSVRGREGGRRGGGCRDRCGGRHAQRHSAGRRSGGARAARGQAAQPEAARHAVLRRRRPARERVCRTQGACAQGDRAECRRRSRR